MKSSIVSATALLASLAVASPASAFSSSVFFDTVAVVQWGVTPDQVEADVGLPTDNNPTSDSQVFAVAYNFNGFLWQTWHSDPYGNADPIWYGVLLQSRFFDTNMIGYRAYLQSDPEDPNVANIVVLLCSDNNCTDWMYGYAADAIPLDGAQDGSGNNNELEIFTNPQNGTMDYTVNGNLASQNSNMAQMQIDASTNYGGSPFSMPVAGMYYQVGCDNLWNSDLNYYTCVVGFMEEVYFYTGPSPVFPITPVIDSFFTTSPSGQIQALHLSSGIAVFGDLPTVYLAGDIDHFLDGNASWFAAQANPEVYQYYSYPLTDSGGSTGGLYPATWNPYPN
jgi:hypothetical protein